MKEWIEILSKTKLLTPKGIFSLLDSLRLTGVNLFAILHTAYKLYPDKIAITTTDSTYTYRELFLYSWQLACWLKQNELITRKQKIAITGENSPELIFTIFASALLGADIYLLNAQMSHLQLMELTDRFNFHVFFHDDDRSYSNDSIPINKNCRILSSAKCFDSSRKQTHACKAKSFRMIGNNFNKLVVLTSGSTGAPTAAGRKASVNNYLQVFISLFKQLKLYRYESLYLAPPLYHGFGIATLCISLLLGKHTFISSGFDATGACRLISKHKIQVMTLVPLMIQRMIEQDAGALSSLECLISGGAPLPVFLLRNIQQTLGDKLYNLYGSSEVGVCTLATPEDLKHFPETIGKPLQGVKIKILLSDKQEAPVETEGELCIRCNWSTNKHKWLQTGDKGYKNKQGYYFLTGRIDNMIVSGGENVYPSELEAILRQHPGIRDVIVISMDDAEFGKRLKTIIIPTSDSILNEEQVMHWLKGRVSRYQMPKIIRLTDRFPMNPVGKPDKEALLKL
ncbi:MAG: AMP-binding protein [Tannerella sp.]|jgi:acyl-CoA synthetase (AMP-forming)/AMP-acid ligase II|nr:AMP-binding protein [Tannerella sp.]